MGPVKLFTPSLLLLLTTSHTTSGFPGSCTPSSPSSGKFCGIKGFLQSEFKEAYAASFPQIVDSVVDCAVLSFRHGGLSFQFSNRTNLCETSIDYSIKRNKPVKRDNKSHYLFYDMSCWDCGDISNQPYGYPLLDNGNFTEDLLGPWTGGGGRIGKGLDGGNAFFCKNEPSCGLGQYFYLLENEYYIIEFDYLAGVSPMNATGVILMGEDLIPITAGNDIAQDFKHARLFIQGTRDGVYQNPTHRPALSLDAYVDYNYRLGANLNLLLTNFQAYRIPKHPVFVEPDNNLIVNGGFETGLITPWEITGFDNFIKKNFTISSSGTNSSYALRFKQKGKYFADLDSPTLKQTVNTVPGKIYYIEFHLSLTMGGDTTRIFLEIGNSEYYRVSELDFGRSENRTISTFFSPFSNETRINLNINNFFNGDEGVIDYFLDDFKMLEVLEGSSAKHTFLIRISQYLFYLLLR